MQDRASAVVVTGAGDGIGRAIATRLIGSGLVVIGLDLNDQSLITTAEMLGQSFVPIVGDIGDEEAHAARGRYRRALGRASGLGQQCRNRCGRRGARGYGRGAWKPRSRCCRSGR